MRDNNGHMIEIMDAIEKEEHYFSIIKLAADMQYLKLQFGITRNDYYRLKNILTSRPFELGLLSNYRYFFAGGGATPGGDREESSIKVRVEYLDKHKGFYYPISNFYIKNLYWFRQLKDMEKLKPFIVVE